MARIRAEFDVSDEDADPDDHTGVTQEMYDSLMEGLIDAGAENVQIKAN